MDQYIGKLLDNRYEILEVIGTGGMAIVYKARCRLLNRFVAIKILKDEFARDDEFRRRFYNESQAVAKLSHNNIVSIYDVSHTEGVEYIVMELIEGITLKEYLQKKGKLSWQESLYFAQQIARALNHAHSRGIIHQDIKPHNIILLRDGTAKVTDFGIAKFAANQETKVIQEAIGSVHYISPEQARGSAIDYRTDIYSLGVVMYEMLTGQLPFEGDTALSIVMQHINAVPLMPSALSEGVPEAMDQIVMHAMCPVLSKRYASAQELYNDLEHLKNDPNAMFNYKEESGRGSDNDYLEATRPIKYDSDEAQRYRERMSSESRGDTGRNRKKRSVIGGLFHKIKSSPVALAVVSVLTFVVAAVILSSLLIFGGNGNNGEMIEVPSFIGKNYETEIATNEEYSKNFEIEISSERVEDPNANEGDVLRQDPNPGEKTEKGGKIILTLCGAPVEKETEIPVPNLAGNKLQDAVAELLKAGIEYEKQEENSEDVEEGTIIRTVPESGQTIKKDEKLLLVVSSGKKLETVKMPNLVGMTLDAARAAVKSKGLKLGTITKKESDSMPDSVISQSIPKDIEVATETVVDIEVAIVKTTDDNGSGNSDSGNGGDNSGNSGSTDGNVKSKALSPIVLPQDRDTARVVVKVGGNVVYDQVHNTSEKTVNVTLKGTGSQLAVIEVEGMPSSEELVNFD